MILREDMGVQSARGLEMTRVGDVESVDALPVGVESAYENGVAASVAEAYVGRGLGARLRGSRARFRTSGARWNAAHPPAGRCHDLPKAAQRRLDILRFWDTHGLEASRGCLRCVPKGPLPVEAGPEGRRRQPGGAGCEILGAQAQANPHGGGETGQRDPALETPLPEPGQGKAPV